MAYTSYFRGLRRAAAHLTALLTLVEPLTGAILAAFVLGQRLSATGIKGAAILLAAVVVTVHRVIEATPRVPGRTGPGRTSLRGGGGGPSRTGPSRISRPER